MRIAHSYDAEAWFVGCEEGAPRLWMPRVAQLDVSKHDAISSFNWTVVDFQLVISTISIVLKNPFR